MKLRSEYKDAFVEKHGVKLGLMSGFVKVRILISCYSWPYIYSWACFFVHHLSFNSLSQPFMLFQAAVSGLQNQPIINAVIDGDDIIYRDYIDISIAVGTKKVRH